MGLNQQQTVTVLYDLAMTIAGETDPRRLATKMVQRLLAHTGYGCGAVLLDVRHAEDGEATAEVFVTVGSRELRALEGQRLAWPAEALGNGHALSAMGWFPGGERYPYALALPVAQVGQILLLTKQLQPMLVEQALTLFPPVMAKFAQSLQLCLEGESHQRSLALARDAAEQASEAKSRFLGSISHELRTPLNAIIGYSELIALDPTIPERLLTHVQAIRGAGDHLLAVVNDLLDLTRIESGNLEVEVRPVPIGPVLDACMAHNRHSAEARQLSLLRDHSLDQAVILADQRRLLQVMNNLVSNAIKYNHAEGRVILSCRATSPERIRLAVTDSGPGIAPERHAELFEPFNRLGAEQGTVEGTGIGLMITRELVAGMHGTLGLESTPGIGSTFWVEFPRAEPVAPRYQAIAAPAGVAATGSRARRVLVAEDHEPNQMVLALQLQRLGYEADMTADGAQALARWRASTYDVVLTDLNMPVMHGIALCEAIRAEEVGTGRRVPIVAITAVGLASEHERCRAVGMDAVLTKPVVLEELRAVLDALAATPTTGGTDAPAPAGPEVDPVLDLRVLERMIGEVSREEVREVIGSFLEVAGRGLAALVAAPADATAVLRETHKVKSSARAVGALRFAAAAATAELEAKAGRPVDLAPMTAALSDVEAALRRY